MTSDSPTPATPAPGRRRIVFVDVDGTLLEHDLVAPGAAEAIAAARANGHLVYLCTGRAAGDLHPGIAAIDVDGEITNGGAYATSGGELILARPMPRADVERLVAFFAADDTPYFLQSYDHVYASPGIGQFFVEFLERRRAEHAADLARLGLPADAEPAGTVRGGERFAPLEAADLDDVAKAVFVSRNDDTLDRARTELGDDYYVIPGSMPMPGGSNGEINERGVTKGSAVAFVLEHLGIDPADAIGIGDSWNDAPMFEAVGTSVAMGNAGPELQALADHVTAPVLEDGVARALGRLGLLA